MASDTPTPSYKILTTPPSRRSFPLPTSPRSYFTGDFFDRLVLFLHKHCVTFTSIECVARGVDKAAALRDGPTLCVYVVQDDSVARRLAQGGKDKELAEAKEKMVEVGNGGGTEGEVSGQEKGRLYYVEEASEKYTQGEQHLEKQQTEEEQVSHYIKEVAQLFKECQFAYEVPPEIRSVEFVGVILQGDPSRNVGTTGVWTNGGVMGFLTG